MNKLERMKEAKEFRKNLKEQIIADDDFERLEQFDVDDEFELCIQRFLADCKKLLDE